MSVNGSELSLQHDGHLHTRMVEQVRSDIADSALCVFSFLSMRRQLQSSGRVVLVTLAVLKSQPTYRSIDYIQGFVRPAISRARLLSDALQREIERESARGRERERECRMEVVIPVLIDLPPLKEVCQSQRYLDFFSWRLLNFPLGPELSG